jgi:glycerophosphoryl diester phosphodiesterase
MLSAIITIISLIVIISVIYIFLTLPRVFDQANMDLLKVDYAHRGLHGGDIPENSLAAYKNAIDNGYGIEIDVQLSSDGEIFVFHDPDAKRMCGVNKKIFEMTAEEIKSLRLNNTNEHIPTLAEVLSLVDGSVPLLIEIKYYAETMKLCASLAEMLDPYYGSFAVQSFDPRVLRYFKKNRPRFARGQLVTNSVKSKSCHNIFIDSALTLLLFHLLSRPDFVSYDNNMKYNFSVFLCKHLFKIPLFAWTIKSETDYNKCRSKKSLTIFEGFEPKA